MDANTLLDTINDLTDLELAILLALTAQSHCLITTEHDLLDDLANELSLIASERFGLSYAVLDLDDYESIDHFGQAILDAPDQSANLAPRTQLANVAIRAGSRAEPNQYDHTHLSPNNPTQLSAIYSDQSNVESRSNSYSQPQTQSQLQPLSNNPHSRQNSYRKSSNAPFQSLDNRTIKSIIIAKNFNLAPTAIQIQALELITAHRFLSHTTLHTTGRQFLFIPLLSTSQHLIPHLNDRIMFSHHHHPEDGFMNLEELDSSRSISASSDIQRSSQDQKLQNRDSVEANDVADTRLIPPLLMEKLASLAEQTALTSEVRRYMQDLVTFLRLARGVDSGVSPKATQDFVKLVKILAPVHGVGYVTPGIVALAMTKVYEHRILLAGVERERSLQYGSEPGAVGEVLRDLRVVDVIESVLMEVACPR